MFSRELNSGGKKTRRAGIGRVNGNVRTYYVPVQKRKWGKKIGTRGCLAEAR